MKSPTFSAEQLVESAWKAIASATLKVDVVPAGWLTRDAVGRIWGRSETATKNKLKLLVADNKAQVKQFKVAIGNNQARNVPHYKLL